ncbi:hypothetical protein [Sorangium sp. So ce233]|uniref:hypothetical protein n=1 Tax=Sorangium sp. So ce233 TaxID=3133290 RepID=UPI003F639CAA
MRTWHVEHAVVVAVLSTVVLATGGALVEWVGAAAVYAGFGHASVSERLAEREAARARPEVHCYAWAARYWVAKELLWLAYFVAHRSWSALVGCGVFLVYPLWRRYWRRIHPAR